MYVCVHLSYQCVPGLASSLLLLYYYNPSANEASGNALGGLQKTEALSSALEKKTGQLAAATEDLEVCPLPVQAWSWWSRCIYVCVSLRAVLFRGCPVRAFCTMS